jgi:tetratricopeptide (TPR) repeat protein
VATPELRPAFAAGEVLAERFRVIRFLAHGGMGEVYEAEDLVLQVPVALKTLRPEIAADKQVIERFRREILLARQVTHPNVCRIFDVFHHRSRQAGDDPPAENLLLVMELLRGETLAARLRRQGRMSTAEALPIVAQMATALAAAHRAGVVHRDFKSGNVMLVQAERGAVRAVVTDFGLARALDAVESSASSLTGSGGLVGTSAYMAPEQVEGADVTPAADIYALGVVIYEMVTGAKPFSGASPLTTALKKLNEPSPSPRTLVPDLDPVWEAAILRCLRRHPADRFGRVDEVANALRDRSAVRVGPILQSMRRRRSASLAAAAVVLAASWVGYQVTASRRTEAAPPGVGAHAKPIGLRRSVALIGFKDLSGRAETAWLSTALAEMLATELAAGEKLRTIPGENVARMKMELDLVDADSLARDTLNQVGRNLGTDLVVLGSYLDLGKESGGRIRVDLRVQDTAAGETIASVAEVGTETELFELVSRAGARLRERLGVERLSTAAAQEVAASRPASADALRLYAEGLARLRLLDALNARDYLQKAVSADPSYAPAHAALAQAWTALGYDGRATEEARTAFDLSAALPREEALWVEARYREAAKEWDRAVEVYRSLTELFPDNLDYGLQLAGAQTSAGKAKDALATIEALRRLPSASAADARIDLVEAEASSALSDYKRSLAAATRAAEKGERQGARLLVARARTREGWALQNLGENPKAAAAFEEARRLHTAAQDAAGAAWTLTYLGFVQFTLGEPVEARKMYDSALAVFRRIGHQRGVATTLNSIGISQWREGKLAEARKSMEMSLAVHRDTGDRGSVARLLNNVAVVVQNQGDLSGAASMYEESLAVQRELGEKRAVATALNNLGNIAWQRGDLHRARKLYAEALSINEETGQKSNVAGTLYNIGEVLTDEGDLAQARQRHDAALAILGQLGEKMFVPEHRLALARIAIAEGKPAEAETAAREAVRDFATRKAVDQEAMAESLLARALLGQGKLADARKAAARATALARKSQSQRVRLSVAIATAPIRAGTGAPAAVRALEAAQAEARKSGRRGLELEASLALGEIELRSGRAAAGRARLEALEEQARAQGFGLLAARAAALKRGDTLS